MPELILKDEVFEVAGAAMDVYFTLGTGFLEPVYQEALTIEMTRRKIPFEREKSLDLYYKGTLLRKKYIADFICFNEIILEIKVVPRLTNIEFAQLINYMKITHKRVGVLANFGSRPKLEWKRIVI
jgi:GxxExxY protein